MKILIVHNYYRSSAPSGENNVVDDEILALNAQGLEVDVYKKHSDELAQSVSKKISTFFKIPWNRTELKRFQRYLNETRPDIVHFHNTFPLLSLSLLYVKTNAKLVMTLHNYRIFCPAGTPFLNQRPCTKCIDIQSTLPAILNKCYRKSRLLTAPLSISSEFHRRKNTLNEKLDRIFVLSEFQKDILVKQGINSSKISIKHNFLNSIKSTRGTQNDKRGLLYVGRLSEEKGLHTLLESWTNATLPDLKIIGDGPLMSMVSNCAAKHSNITYLGKLGRKEILNAMQSSKALIFPSIWFEGMPLVLLEAMSQGLPIIGSKLGAIPEVCGNECAVYFEPGDSKSLQSVVLYLSKNEALLSKLSTNAKIRFKDLYREKVVINKQIKEYESLLS